MNITSFEFALFFAVILPLNWLLRSRAGVYRLFLLLTSYVFYASFNAKFLLILLVFSFQTWFFAVIFAETSDARFRRFCVFLYAAFSLGILIFFKYYEMLYISADGLYRVFGAKSPVPLLDVIMPIGISFFTFQGMSYALDVYRDPSKCERSLVEVLCFIAFFPTILSGPILRAGNFLPQLKKERVTGTDFNRAFFLLTRGLVKKIIISSYLSEHIVRSTFGAPEGFTSLAVLVGILSYAVQIYCDFSGYSDLAQGVALLMGFDVPDNFNLPYVALSLRDFWRRWHITFSLWLRDYLYIISFISRSWRQAPARSFTPAPAFGIPARAAPGPGGPASFVGLGLGRPSTSSDVAGCGGGPPLVRVRPGLTFGRGDNRVLAGWPESYRCAAERPAEPGLFPPGSPDPTLHPFQAPGVLSRLGPYCSVAARRQPSRATATPGARAGCMSNWSTRV